jgi:hypothetical protein
MPLTAFLPQGATALIAATTTASAAIQVSTGAIQGCKVVVQGSTQHVFLAFGQSTATAVLPTTGTPALGMPVQPGSDQTFTIPPGAWVSAITSSGTANVFLTPGFGQ